MSELSVSGPQLKKLIKKTKKKPLGFGFNPGAKPEGSVFTMDLKKQPKVLGKAAKDDGESSKVAFGTASLDGKVLKLMVERMLPALAKNVKKFLKFNKVMLNVEIYDENGNLLESDVEDNLPDDPEMDGSDDDDDDDLDAGSDDDTAEDGDDAGSDDEAEEDDAASDKKDENADTALSAADVAKQLGALKPRIQAQPAEIAGKLTPPFQQAVAALKGGKIEEAAATAGKIESALDKLEGGAKAKPQEAEIPQAPPLPDPQMLKLMQMVEAMRARGNLITDPGRLDTYNKALDRAASLIQGKETEQAVTLLKKLQEMLKQLSAAKPAADAGASDSEAAQADNSAGENEGSDAAPTAAQIEWEKAFAELQPQVDLATTNRSVVNFGQLKLNWDMAIDKSIDDDFEGALALLPGVRRLLAEKVAEGTNADTHPYAAENGQIAKARLNWITARNTMEGEIRKLQGAITAVLSQEEDVMEMIGAEVNALTTRLKFIEDELQDRLNDIVNCEPADEAKRTELKNEVKSIIKSYGAELETGFFQDVDANNGFETVAVAGPARAALAEISGAL